MNKDEILKYYKLCFEFLGYKNITPDDKDFNLYEKLNGEIGDMIEIISAKFDSDWDWIMKVVEAIEGKVYTSSNESIYIVNIWNKVCKIETVNEEIYWVKGNTKKEAVVNAIYKFLIWFNKNKN